MGYPKTAEEFLIKKYYELDEIYSQLVDRMIETSKQNSEYQTALDIIKKNAEILNGSIFIHIGTYDEQDIGERDFICKILGLKEKSE